jgi:hypothetical protein
VGKFLNKVFYAYYVIEIFDVRPARHPATHLIFSKSGSQPFGDGIRTAITKRIKGNKVDLGTLLGVGVDALNLLAS